MHQNIGWHTRLRSNANVKAAGGSFGGNFSLDTANRLARLFTVKVLPSGTPVFVDREGREVWLYMTIDARETDAGKAAMAEHRKAEAARQHIEDEKAARVQELMDSMSNDELLKRLS